ncbi:hypothetical protein SDC9_37167 [bioreactor metagenome]|uniref:Uncharacterized protein n=1 Tax=bioreactor metagenome TaxID=1076179 RepID=A0A644VI86_9ZZZZ
MARGGARPRQQPGRGSAATILAGEAAAWREATAGRWRDQAGRAALDRHQVPAAACLSGQRRQQGAGVGMGRVVKHLAHRAGLDDAAGIHHRHPVADLRHHAQIVGDQDDRGAGAVAPLAQQPQDLVLHRDVERGRRFVGDNQPRPQRQCHRDHHALTQPAREFVRIGVKAAFRRGHVHVAQQPERRLPRLGPADLAVAQDHLGDLPADPHRRVQRGERILEDEGDLAAAHLCQCALGHGGKVAHPVEQDLPARDARRRAAEQAQDGPAGGRLAAARLADDAEDLARGDVEADPVDRAHDPRRAAELGPEVADAEKAHGLSLRLQRDRQPLAHKREGDADPDDGEARKHGHPGRLAHVVDALDDQDAPFRRRRLDTEAEEGQGRHRLHRQHHVRHRIDQRRGDRIRQDMAQEHPQLAEAQHARRLDVFEPGDEDRLAAHDAGIADPVHQEEGDVEVRLARPEHADDGQHQHVERKGPDDIGQPHQRGIDPAAEEARDKADHGARKHRHEDADDRDAQVEHRPGKDPGEDVTAEIVGAEPVACGRRLHRRAEIERIGIPGREPGRQGRRCKRQRQHREAGRARRAAQKMGQDAQRPTPVARADRPARNRCR